MANVIERVIGKARTAPATLRVLGHALFAALVAAGCATEEWEQQQAAADVETTTSELVCNGTNCTCSPTFGIGFAQGTDGTGSVKNFELAVPHTNGGFSAYWRDNADLDPDPNASIKAHTWRGAIGAGGTQDINGIALLENTVPVSQMIPGNGNLEVVAVRDGSLVHFWRDRATKVWSSGNTFASGVTGQPGFTQSKSDHRNFEVVVARAPAQGGGLVHYWRDNLNPSFPWSGPFVFATGRNYEAVSLIESDYAPNRLEVVARSGTTLFHVWREGTSNWQTPREIVSDTDGPIAASPTGVPSFVQAASPAPGVRGNFHLVVPLATGLRHFIRDNSVAPDPYHHWFTVNDWVDQTRPYSAVGLIWSGFGDPLNAVGRRSDDGSLAAFSFDDETNTWVAKGNDSAGAPLWSGAVFGGEPCCNPATHGLWQNPFNSSAIAAHAALMRDGRVLLFGFGDDENMGDSELFDPSNGAGTEPGGAVPHAFCSGHAHLPDGRLWVAGGHGDDHVTETHQFAPQDIRWSTGGSMGPFEDYAGRWYPTLVRLPTGSILAISGNSKTGRISPADDRPVNSTYQIFSAFTGISARVGVPNPFSDGTWIQLYPFVFQLPDGRVLVHSYRTSRFLTIGAEQEWSDTQYQTQSPYSRNYPGYGSAVLLPLQASENYRARIMLFGGGGEGVSNTGNSDPADTGRIATNTVEQLDLGAPSPAWTYRTPMNHRRVLNTAVLLPDGKVFVVGGSTHGSSDHATTPVMTPEIYDPVANTSTNVCPMRVARLYHSTALLLPDARVLTAGRDHAFNEFPYKWPDRRVEIYRPPYLLNGNPRPLLSTSSGIFYGQSFSVFLAANSPVPVANIGSVVLMSPGSVTHGYDMGQRAVSLAITNRSGNMLTVTAPPDGMVAPPGDYMLFVVSNLGVPSISRWVTVGPSPGPS